MIDQENGKTIFNTERVVASTLTTASMMETGRRDKEREPANSPAAMDPNTMESGKAISSMAKDVSWMNLGIVTLVISSEV